MATENRKESFLNTIKMWIFPSLVTVLSLMIWRDINEMRTDIKALLAQTNIDKTKIENLQQDVKQLEQVVFGKKLVAQTTLPWFMKLYFKPEEQYDVKKYIPKNV